MAHGFSRPTPTSSAGQVRGDCTAKSNATASGGNIVYAPLILTLHVCITFAVLARLAVKAPAAFRGVRAAMLVTAAAVAWSTPLVALLLIVPVVAANQFRFVSIPDVFDFSALFPNAESASG